MTTATSIARNLRPTLGKPGIKTARACDVRDILIAIRASQTAKRHVCVYSSAGFVPRAYKYKCQIQYVAGTKTESGWTFRTGWTAAQRPHGHAPLVVVQ